MNSKQKSPLSIFVDNAYADLLKWSTKFYRVFFPPSRSLSEAHFLTLSVVFALTSIIALFGYFFLTDFFLGSENMGINSIGDFGLAICFFILAIASFFPSMWCLEAFRIKFFNYLKPRERNKQTLDTSVASYGYSQTKSDHVAPSNNGVPNDSKDDIFIRVSKVEESIKTRLPLSRDEVARYVDTVIADELVQKVSAQYDDLLRSNIRYGELDKYCNAVESRLLTEIDALTKRSNVNLFIGLAIIILASGLLIFSYFDIPDTPEDSLLHTYIIRISVGIFLGAFAYFFLHVYSSILAEIKYYQNELTNIELLFLALRRLAMTEKPVQAHEKLIVDALISTERNFILKKGQTTVELEKSQLENQFLMNLIDFSNLKPKSSKSTSLSNKRKKRRKRKSQNTHTAGAPPAANE